MNQNGIVDGLTTVKDYWLHFKSTKSPLIYHYLQQPAQKAFRFLSDVCSSARGEWNLRLWANEALGIPEAQLITLLNMTQKSHCKLLEISQWTQLRDSSGWLELLWGIQKQFYQHRLCGAIQIAPGPGRFLEKGLPFGGHNAGRHVCKLHMHKLMTVSSEQEGIFNSRRWRHTRMDLLL